MNDNGSSKERIAELEADNQRLRRLLDLQNAPQELRHRQRHVMALLRTIIRRSADTRHDLDDYVAHLQDRLDALHRAQFVADSKGEIDLELLLAEELCAYALAENERFSLSGPPVKFTPKAGQVFALAIHELAVNAIEHGALGDDGGTLEATWRISGDTSAPLLHFRWKEVGKRGIEAPDKHGFGWEVLTQTLPYELQVKPTIAFESDGLLCDIEVAVTPLIGRIG